MSGTHARVELCCTFLHVLRMCVISVARMHGGGTCVLHTATSPTEVLLKYPSLIPLDSIDIGRSESHFSHHPRFMLPQRDCDNQN